MFGFRLSVKNVAAVLLAALIASGAGAAQAQSAHRTRRESNANRKARIARTIQETYSHRWEVGGGGGYQRFRSGENLQRNNQVTWETWGQYNLSPKLGIVVNGTGAYGSAKISNFYSLNNIFRPSIQQYNIMGGASYRFYTKEKLSASAQALGGVSFGLFQGNIVPLRSEQIGMWPSETRPAFSVGLNLDYNLYPNFAIRVAPTYTGTTFGGTVQNNLGFKVGVVYRFGKIK
jgi:opacity protein-like surface antigen